ncbi:ribosome maturation factor RimM [Planococcus shenhongbingii]|uniref:Ribosome maturation factor RimM n=1 Tax=Planococcus shenhongbingii TaxID=3058398 RepID=A0ABT8N8Y7_9BACL|nr:MULTISPECIES: ribosome maturation factor RimM [unclassified Planococcus (in: firmicutes)]MDN7244208.1 ribosome maturation factor RimM [Planococcus sp. N017]WKA57382.1 ribosome maturation factor RimM [Planococcus sp. N016]
MEWFNVGKIVNTHGIRGEVRVLSRTDFPEERFAVGMKLGLFKPDAKKPIMVKIASHRQHKNFELLTFEGYPNINDVVEFKDSYLRIAEHDLTELEDHAYYHHEILGCTVFSTEGQEIGIVTEILETGANDVWEVTPKSGKKHYIPYIEDVVKEIDVDEKKVVIDVLEGLLNE